MSNTIEIECPQFLVCEGPCTCHSETVKKVKSVDQTVTKVDPPVTSSFSYRMISVSIISFIAGIAVGRYTKK